VALAGSRVTSVYGAVVGPSDTVLVGDTSNDINAAHDSGARAVAIATESTTAEELTRAGADAVLADLRNTDAVVYAILAGAC
jgi:phosphoglycolate phosphatase